FAPVHTTRAVTALKRTFRIAAQKTSSLKFDSVAPLRSCILADAALVRGQLTHRQRRQVARGVAKLNSFGPSSATMALPLRKLSRKAARAAADRKAGTILRFTQAVVLQRGGSRNGEFQTLWKAGFSDPQFVEGVGNIAVNLFSTYFKSMSCGTAAADDSAPQSQTALPLRGRRVPRPVRAFLVMEGFHPPRTRPITSSSAGTDPFRPIGSAGIRRSHPRRYRHRRPPEPDPHQP